MYRLSGLYIVTPYIRKKCHIQQNLQNQDLECLSFLINVFPKILLYNLAYFSLFWVQMSYQSFLIYQSVYFFMLAYIAYLFVFNDGTQPTVPMLYVELEIAIA